MHFARPLLAADQRSFGRGRQWLLGPLDEAAAFALSDELKLFAGTFAAGFLFVSLLIA